MMNNGEFTRRGLLVTAGAVAMTSTWARGDDTPMFDDSKPTTGIAIRAPSIPRRWMPLPLSRRRSISSGMIRRLSKSPTRCSSRPRHADCPGPSRSKQVFEVTPATGKILRTVQTESIHGSGITIGDGAWWITSTQSPVGENTPMDLKVDPQTGKTLKKVGTPGWGFYGPERTPRPGQPPALPSGGHDVKWAGHGQYWMAGTILRSHLPDGR